LITDFFTVSPCLIEKAGIAAEADFRGRIVRVIDFECEDGVCAGPALRREEGLPTARGIDIDLIHNWFLNLFSVS
jgi:hypothetical protein